MKAVFIVFNQAHTERVEYMLDRLEIRGYTWWTDVNGRGTETGEPRMGTHTWPEMNSAALTIILINTLWTWEGSITIEGMSFWN